MLGWWSRSKTIALADWSKAGGQASTTECSPAALGSRCMRGLHDVRLKAAFGLQRYSIRASITRSRMVPQADTRDASQTAFKNWILASVHEIGTA